MANYRVIYHDELSHRSSKAISKTFYCSKEYLDDVRGNSGSEKSAAKYIAMRQFPDKNLDENDNSWRAEISVGQQIKGKGRYYGMYPVKITVHFNDSLSHDHLSHREEINASNKVVDKEDAEKAKRTKELLRELDELIGHYNSFQVGNSTKKVNRSALESKTRAKQIKILAELKELDPKTYNKVKDIAIV